MVVTGKFKVKLVPQPDDDVPAGRMVVKKTYSGAVEGTGRGQMISKRLPNGTAIYYAVEEFAGTVDGRKGRFTLLHEGRMDSDSQSLTIDVLEGSGTGALKTISGSMTISQHGETHSFALTFDLQDGTA